MDSAARLVGQVLGGRYRLLGILGQGGVGTVYEAVQEDLGRKVAVKVLHIALASDPSWARRMEREARATAALDHPNVVQITDFQLTPGGLPFLVMERLTGRSLRDLIEKEAPLPAERVVNIALQTLSALDAAHRAGVVHRDIKPENLFLVSTPAVADFVKVLDFGIAKAIEGTTSSGALSVTHTGAVLGTHGYMPPEQSRGEPLDARADVFAIGACMYEALAGRAASNDALTVGAGAPSRATERSATGLRAIRPDVDPALATIVMRALEHEQSARFATAQEMIDALRALQSGSARVPTESELAPTAPLARPIQLPVGGGSTLVTPTTPYTPRAVTPPPPPMRTMPAPAPTGSRLGWAIPVFVALFVLVPSCVALVLVAAHRPDRSTRDDRRQASTDPPPQPSATTTTVDRSNDTPDEAPVESPTATAPSKPRVPRAHDAGRPALHVVDASSPSPSPSPSPSRPPDQNPPPLEYADARFLQAIDVKDPQILSNLDGFVRKKVTPLALECFRTYGFAHQANRLVSSQVQFMVHSDGHVDSFVEHTFDAVAQASCIEKKLRATSAAGVCVRDAPPACTIYVVLEGKYR